MNNFIINVRTKLSPSKWMLLFLSSIVLAITGCNTPTNLEISTDTVDVCSADQIDDWKRVMDDQQGVDGLDPEGHRIGSYPADRGIFLGRNWYPADTEKQVLCGKLKKFNFYDGSGDEADWNNFVIPDSPYAHLITDLESIREEPWLTTGWHSCDGRDCMEAEITPDEHFYGNPWFPKVFGDSRDKSPLEGQTICTYGPWVWEEAHGNRPEIHPSELYWWKWGDDAVRLMLLHDDSNRFYDSDDFSDLPSTIPDWWRPWSKAPRTGEFKVPFEVNVDSIDFIPTYLILEPGQYVRNVITDQFPDARRDSDNGTDHAIDYNGDIVLRANEIQLDDDRIGVQFVDICRDSADSRLQGYLQLTSVVGQDDSGKEGYHVIDVLRYELSSPEEDPPFTQPTAPDITVLTGKTLRQTLQRRETDSQPELVADLEVRLPGRDGEESPVVTISKVERIEGDERQELEFQPNTEDKGEDGLLGVVKAVPALSGSVLELTTDDEKVFHLSVPQVSLAPLMSQETPLLIESDPRAWDTMLAISGSLADAALPQVAELQRVRQWQLDAVPYYAPLRSGIVSVEEDSPTSEELTEVWERGDQPQLLELFGSGQPFTVDWSFEAVNLGTGDVVPVVTNGVAGPTEIQVEFMEGTIPNASIQISFPEEAPEDIIYEVIATATFKDTLGTVGGVQSRVWSHVLTAEDSDALVEALLALSAAEAGSSPNEVIAASNLDEADPANRRARTLRLMTMRAAADLRITIAELSSQIKGAKLLVND